MIDIVVATDPSYLAWAATAIRSVLDHHKPGTVSFHLLHDPAMPQRSMDKLKEMAEGAGASLTAIAVRDERVDDLPAGPGGSRVTWFRTLIPEILADLPRGLLLDADTFVTQSLDTLWATDLESKPLAAVCNVVEPAMRSHIRELGLSDPNRYLNAGVLLMDLEAMRNEDATAAMMRFAAGARDRIRWLDQDTLNVVFEGRFLALQPRWNAMNSLWTWKQWASEVYGTNAVREATTRPGILHFEGPAFSKPWHYLSTHPWRDAYREALVRTPWGSSTPIEGRSWSTRAIRLLPARFRPNAYWRLQRLRHRRSVGES